MNIMARQISNLVLAVFLLVNVISPIFGCAPGSVVDGGIIGPGGSVGSSGSGGMAGASSGRAAQRGGGGTGVTTGVNSSGISGGTGDVLNTGVIDSCPKLFNAGSAPNRNEVRAGGICERISTIQCAGEQCCCDNPGRNFETCKQEMKSYCTDQLFIDAASQNPIVGYDEAFAETAFATYEEKAKLCDPGVASWGSSMDGLRGIFKGTVESGKSCRPPLSLGGIPTKDKSAAALLSCKDAPNCACMTRGLIYDWTCDPPSSAGGGCFSDINCTDGLYCDNPNAVLAGSACKQRKAAGADCSLPNECESLMCKKDKCVPADRQAAYCLRND